MHEWTARIWVFVRHSWTVDPLRSAPQRRLKSAPAGPKNLLKHVLPGRQHASACLVFASLRIRFAGEAHHPAENRPASFTPPFRGFRVLPRPSWSKHLARASRFFRVFRVFRGKKLCTPRRGFRALRQGFIPDGSGRCARRTLPLRT